MTIRVVTLSAVVMCVLTLRAAQPALDLPIYGGPVRPLRQPAGFTTVPAVRMAFRPAVAMRHGLAFLTEDRKDTGCFLPLSITENMQMAMIQDRFTASGFVRQSEVDRRCEAMSETMRVKTPDLDERIENLSGGNQQKVLIGRWLLTKPKILILDEPTRGIDVGAKAEIHRLISRLAGEGLAVIMISSELPEVLGMSDRVMVVHGGRVTGILDRSEATQEKVMDLASS